MFVTALLLGLVGVFCILDSRILGRMNFERPLITCTIVGALLGDLQTGLTLGASIELMSLGIVNIGAAAPPDMNMAAIICATFTVRPTTLYLAALPVFPSFWPPAFRL